MIPPFRVLSLLALAGTTAAVRVTENFEDANPVIDWSFMARKFTYNRREAGLWSWIKRVVFDGRRRTDHLKDEIALEHACNKEGFTRDQTYYASSLCYWFPDIKDPDATKSFGLQWQGGKSDGAQLCEEIPDGPGGRCVKCGVCHNNARNAKGEATYSSFIDEVDFDTSDCYMESQIDAQITQLFQTKDQAHRDLTEDYQDCTLLLNTFRQASEALSANQAEETAINARLAQIPTDISLKEDEISDSQGTINSIDLEVVQKRREAGQHCNQYSRSEWKQNLFSPDVSHETILRGMGRELRCPCQAEVRGPLKDHGCYDCLERGKYPIEHSFWRMTPYKRRIAELRVDITSFQSEDEAARARLQDVESLQVPLTQDKDVAETAWNSRRSSCEPRVNEYKLELSKEIDVKSKDYYESSCEKACLQQISKGCGVVESARPGDVSATGGVDTTCNPPSLSWINAYAYNHVKLNSIDRATALAKQCDAVSETQQPKGALAILKSGVLYKRERLFWRWRPRFFAFESGDEARSAVMRYWIDRPDPMEQSGQEERYDKGIIIWDARGVSGIKKYEVDGRTRFCFHLLHFYRDFRLCVKGGGSLTEDEADLVEWTDLVKNHIFFPDMGRKNTLVGQ